MSDDPTQQQPVEPAVEQPAPDPEAEAEPTEPAARPKPSPIERLERVAARARAAEEEARYWRERATQQPAAPEPRPEPAREPEQPRRDQFQNPDDYDAALVRWATETALHRQRAESAAEEAVRREAETRAAAQRAQQEEIQRVETEWGKRREAFMGEHPDFPEVAEARPDEGGPVITHEMKAAIFLCENGPAIAYHLGHNPQESQRIAGLDSFRQMFEISRLSGVLSLGTARAPTSPNPIRPLRAVNAAATRKSPEEETQAEYSARRRAERKAAGLSPY